MGAVRDGVETRLRAFLDDRRRDAVETCPESVELVDAIAGLTLRGGKRLRPQVAAAAFLGVRPDGDPADTVDAGAAIEMLQTFLLIHDDWMDLDEERRGGPSVWAWLRDRHGDAHLGASLAVLAGDLAAVYASELIAGAPFPDRRRGDAFDAFLQMQREVFFGQHLDLVAGREDVPDFSAAGAARPGGMAAEGVGGRRPLSTVERMYDLKTGSYTVRGPMRLGALLADAEPRQLEALDRLAAPLGIAFQLRDELLGTFGDARVLGKPTGNDLRAGKRTVLLSETRARGTAEQVAAVERVLGRADAPDDEVERAVDAVRASGARERVEERLRRLLAEAEAALEDAPLAAGPLREVADLLAFRDR